MHSSLMYSYLHEPFRQDCHPVLSQDQSPDTPFPALFLIQPFQKQMFPQIHFLFFFAHCLSLPFRFRHHPLVDKAKYLIPNFHLYPEASHLPVSTSQLVLQTVTLLVKSLLFSRKILLLPQVYQTSESFSHHNFSYLDQLETFLMHLLRQVLSARLISSEYILKVL